MMKEIYVRRQIATSGAAIGRRESNRPTLTNMVKRAASIALSANVSEFLSGGGVIRRITRAETYENASPQLRALLGKPNDRYGAISG
jgi:hypothetical protein